MKPLYKQLILNILNEYGDRLGNDGCNDLYFENDPLLTGVNLEELKEEFNTLMKEEIESADYPDKLTMNLQLVDMVVKAVKQDGETDLSTNTFISTKEQGRLIKGNVGHICPNCLASRDVNNGIYPHAVWCAIKRETE